jgi:hypothetical protein
MGSKGNYFTALVGLPDLVEEENAAASGQGQQQKKTGRQGSRAKLSHPLVWIDLEMTGEGMEGWESGIFRFCFVLTPRSQ